MGRVAYRRKATSGDSTPRARSNALGETFVVHVGVDVPEVPPEVGLDTPRPCYVLAMHDDTLLSAARLRDAGRSLSAANHPGTIRSFYPFWDAQYRPFLIHAVRALPAERFDFKPSPELMTAHQMILHIAEAERGWIHNVVDGGTYEEWTVPHEDPAQGWVTVHDAPDHAALLATLEEWHRPTQRWFERPASELARVIVNRQPGGPERACTLHWILDHVQEHEIHHRAQLNLYLRLMGIEPPSI